MRDDPRLTSEGICSHLRTALMETRGLGRRELIESLGGLLGGAALAQLPGAITRANAATLPVTAFVFGGAWKKAAAKAFGEPFTQKTGIPVAYQDPYTFPKLRAMHEAHAMQVDVVSIRSEEHTS